MIFYYIIICIYIISGPAGQDRAIRLWDVETGRLRRALTTRHGLGVCSVAFAPAGDAVASGGRDRVVQARAARPRV